MHAAVSSQTFNGARRAAEVPFSSDRADDRGDANGFGEGEPVAILSRLRFRLITIFSLAKSGL
jgi:hypothetical protein